MSKAYELIQNYRSDVLLEAQNTLKIVGTTRGDLPCDNGTNVVMVSPSVNNQTPAMNSFTAAGSGWIGPVAGTGGNQITTAPIACISLSSSTNRYTGFNPWRASQEPTALDWTVANYDCQIVRIIITPGSSQRWPNISNNQRWQFAIGTVDGTGTWNQLAPNTNPHFTVGGSNASIGGVTHFVRDNSNNPVDIDVSSFNWNLLAGDRFTMRVTRNFSYSGITAPCTTWIYIKGAFY